MRLRFNDLLATVLAIRADSPATLAVIWRQCLDLCAQFDELDSQGDVEQGTAFARLEELRSQVPIEVKLASVAELGRRLRSPRLIRLLMQDEPRVTIAVMQVAQVDDGQLAALVPSCTPLARSVLRARPDIGQETRRALATFGPSDLTLSPPEIVPAHEQTATATGAEETVSPAAGTGSKIMEIVERIEKFTHHRQTRSDAAIAPALAEAITEHDDETVFDTFPFVTDMAGLITDTDDALRPLLIGLQLGSVSSDGRAGADGQIVGAFRKRSAFHDGRLTIADGPLRGQWLLSGEPHFNRAGGRFIGYAGDARRAGPLDQAPRVNDGAISGQVPTATSLRELVHELRTPLTAALGFAELIETQLLGPVSERYREMASSIATDARGLVEILEDLDIANRADRLRETAGPGGTDLAASLRNAIDRFAPAGSSNAGSFVLNAQSGLPGVGVGRSIADRLTLHLIRSAAACMGNEICTVTCRTDASSVVVSVSRPTGMGALPESALLDASFDGIEGRNEGSPLGVGFTLRLVRRLAAANGGSLSIDSEALVLRLPAAESATDEVGGSN